MGTVRHAEITDALARGRLAAAEIAAIPPRELEALYETAARCLDAARDELAADLLGGLVTLFPYSARYWRAYAIALHRRLEIERSRTAYEASLALDPSHELTRCYLAEILIYAGHLDRARRDLRDLLDATDEVAAERAGELLAQLDALARWAAPEPEPEEPAPKDADQPRFELDETRDLPLSPSPYEEVEEPTEPLVLREATRTAVIFAPTSDGPTAPVVRPEGTDTALLRRRADRSAAANEGSTTALIPGRRGRSPESPAATATGTATAMLPGRKVRPPTPASGPQRAEPTAASEEPTQTHVEEPTRTDLLEEEHTVTAAVMRRDGCLTFAREND